MRKALALFAAFIFITFLIGCARKPINAKTSTKNFPTTSFVKVITKISIGECQENSPCMKGEYLSTGSGIAIGTISGGTLVLTAGHVCKVKLGEEAKQYIKEFSTDLVVVNFNKKVAAAKIVKVAYAEDDKRDLCLLYATGLTGDYVNFAARAPRKGDQVYAMAAPVGIYHAPTVPLFSGIFSGGIENGNVLTTIPATGGSSGSAVLNEKMKIVGVLYATAKGFNNISLASSYIDTLLFVDEAVKLFLSKPVKSWKSNH